MESKHTFVCNKLNNFYYVITFYLYQKNIFFKFYLTFSFHLNYFSHISQEKYPPPRLTMHHLCILSSILCFLLQYNNYFKVCKLITLANETTSFKFDASFILLHAVMALSLFTLMPTAGQERSKSIHIHGPDL